MCIFLGVMLHLPNCIQGSTYYILNKLNSYLIQNSLLGMYMNVQLLYVHNISGTICQYY